MPASTGISYKELDERLENDPNIVVCWKWPEFNGKVASTKDLTKKNKSNHIFNSLSKDVPFMAMVNNICVVREVHVLNCWQMFDNMFLVL